MLEGDARRCFTHGTQCSRSSISSRVPLLPCLPCPLDPSRCECAPRVSVACVRSETTSYTCLTPIVLPSFLRLTASQVHWFSIVNSLLIVLFLTAMIAMILIRNLHRDIMRYNRIPTDEEKAEEREETGWKVLHFFCGGGVGTALADFIPGYLLCMVWCHTTVDPVSENGVSCSRPLKA